MNVLSSQFITERRQRRKETFQGSFSPEAVSDLHVVVPAQVAPEDVQGCEIQDNLGARRSSLEGLKWAA